MVEWNLTETYRSRCVGGVLLHNRTIVGCRPWSLVELTPDTLPCTGKVLTVESELWEADAEARNRIGVANVFHPVCRRTRGNLVGYKRDVHVSFMLIILEWIEITCLLLENGCFEVIEVSWLTPAPERCLGSMAKAGGHVGRYLSTRNLEAG